MKKTFTLLFAIVIWIGSFSQISFDQFLNLPYFKNATITVFIKDLYTNKIIINYNSNKLLSFASVQKLLTTAAALEIFGPDYSFKTSLQYSGSIKDSILYGNIYILGGGDPSLGSKLFPQNQNFLEAWINAVKKLNIKAVHGNIIADPSIFDFYPTPGKWAWEDLSNYYGAAPTAICVFDNTLNVVFQTFAPNTQTKILQTYPHIPELKIINLVTAANIHHDNSYFYGSPFCFTKIVKGQLPAHRQRFIVRAAIPDPPLLTAQILKNALDSAHITVSGKALTTRLLPRDSITPVKYRTTFLNYFSPPLSQIIYQTNHKSINLYAEVLLKDLAVKYFGKGTTKLGIRALHKFLSDQLIDTSQVLIVDGSGLSRYNAISAKAIASLLDIMYKSPNFDIFFKSLPTAGVDGTLKHFGEDTELYGNLHAKTGTLSRVKALAGYLTSKQLHPLIIVIAINNFNCSSSTASSAIMNLLLNIYQKW